MNLFLYMPIISPKKKFINGDFFSFFFFFVDSTALQQEHVANPWKALRHVENLHPAHVDTKWLVYYGSQWPGYMRICFHDVAVARVRSWRALWYAEWRQGPEIRDRRCVVRAAPQGTVAPRTQGIKVGGVMNEITHPSILFLQAAAACLFWGLSAYCYSNPRLGWKQPLRWQEFSLPGWGVRVPWSA